MQFFAADLRNPFVFERFFAIFCADRCSLKLTLAHRVQQANAFGQPKTLINGQRGRVNGFYCAIGFLVALK